MKKPDNLYRKEVAKEYLQNLVYGFERSRVLFTAVELEIFSILSERPKTSEEVAAVCDADERACNRLLNALCSIGMLEKHDEKFENHRVMGKFLVPDSPEYMGNISHMSHLWESWSHLTESVKKGTAPELECMNHRCEKWLESFVAAMDWRAKERAPDVVNLISIDPFSKILDLGCGSGAYSIEFVKSKPEILVTAFDYPAVVPFTERYVEESGHKSKIEVVGGNIFEDDLGKGYDLVFMSSLIHSYSIWENMEIARKVYNALKPGGKVVVHDYIIDDSRTSPEHSALFALNMLVNTKAGDTYIFADIWIMLKEAWFKNVERIETGHGTSLVIAAR